MKIALGLVFIAAGLFYTLTAFKILHPYKNRPEKLEHIEKYKHFYQLGGLIITAYGFYKLIQ